MLVTAEDIRARVNFLDADIADPQIDPHIKCAARRLKRWVGETAYDDAGADNPSDTDRADDLQNAEAALTLHFLLLWLNTNITPRGQVKTAKSEGSVEVQYFAPADVAKMSELFFGQAEELCRDYMQSPDAISTVELV